MSQTATRFIREMMHISDNVFYISLSILLLILCFIIIYWFYTRKKMQELKHQIPATVLKNYLDSVIQNSNALKSSLFRGGGLEAGEGIPSVVPAGSLPTGNVGVSSEELAQKNAEIAALNGQIGNKNAQIKELERLLAEGGSSNDGAEEIAKLTGEVASLKAQLEAARNDLADAGSSDGGDSETVAALEAEKVELQNRLKEYEIIEEDLANLRRLQQENEQLKETINQLQAGGAAPAPAAEPEPAPEPVPEPAPEPVAEAAPAPAEDLTDAPVADEEEDLEAAMAAAITESQAPAEEPVSASDEDMMVPSNEGEQKSAEELLSEFEKMLG
ncbi:hypothetical protein [Bacteriovorax sp. Seq25_V]|uniref:hypothetical protein n=1 Tax=Bacteriovorax sp. Seq25_V TaxID=1201288 RepID=UPI000389F8B4|nr:hypothetical protein [Bacteriovorax sp. Seq25_V]EQC47272.1 hypothetical protein M900_0721 [Bacteriovorax sp. Seq25_V]